MAIERERGWDHDHLGTLPPAAQALIREEYRMRVAEIEALQKQMGGE